METPSVKLLYFSMEDPSMVIAATAQIKRVLQSRHRSESVYDVANLTAAAFHGGPHCHGPDLGAASDLAGHSFGQRHRHHEHHAGYGDFAHPARSASARAIGATNREIRFHSCRGILISLIGGFAELYRPYAILTRCDSSPNTAFQSRVVGDHPPLSCLRW